VMIHFVAAPWANHFALCHLVFPFNYPARCCPGHSAVFSPSTRARPRICRRA
jgi:hypothetical protein